MGEVLSYHLKDHLQIRRILKHLPIPYLNLGAVRHGAIFDVRARDYTKLYDGNVVCTESKL
jgi:hypothetical protein